MSVISLSKECRSIVQLQKNPGNPFLKRMAFHKIFDNSHFKFGKMEKGKIKNNIFNSPFIVNQTFSQTEFIICKSDFAHIMHFE